MKTSQHHNNHKRSLFYTTASTGGYTNTVGEIEVDLIRE